MSVLAVLNEKGGVGKTTLARHIAAGAALHNLRVLLIDTDSQGHCGVTLGLGKAPGLYRLLAQGAPWQRVLAEPDAGHWSGRAPNVGRLFVLPSDISTRDITPDNPLLLRERLQELDSAIDLVVMDTSPTPVKLQNVLMLAADAVLYPTQCQSLSLDGINETMGHMAALDATRLEYGLKPLKFMGIVPTMYAYNELVHGAGLDILRNHFGGKGTWEPMARRTVWQTCEWEQQTIFAYAPKDEAADYMRRMVRRVLKTLKLRREPTHA